MKDASLATAILGVAVLFSGMVAASAAPAPAEPTSTYSFELPASVSSVGGADLSFETKGGASLDE